MIFSILKQQRNFLSLSTEAFMINQLRKHQQVVPQKAQHHRAQKLLDSKTCGILLNSMVYLVNKLHSNIGGDNFRQHVTGQMRHQEGIKNRSRIPTTT
jgi:hypothetical protein